MFAQFSVDGRQCLQMLSIIICKLAASAEFFSGESAATHCLNDALVLRVLLDAS